MSPAAARRLHRHDRHVCLACQSSRAIPVPGPDPRRRDHTCVSAVSAPSSNGQGAAAQRRRHAAPLQVNLARRVETYARPRDLFARA